MNAIIETAGRLNDATRAAKNLLAEMGSSRWTPRDQSQFDMHMDAADAAKDRLDALLHASGHANVIRDQAREGLDLFIRKDAKNMSASEVGKVRNTMSTTTASQGGYSVMPLVAGEFVNLLKGYGWVRQVATQRSTAGGADMTFPTSDGAAEIGEQLAQNVTATAADPSFAALPIPVYKFSSKIFTVPLELLQDAQIDMVAFVTQRARDRIGRIQNTKFTTGTGTGEATGIVTAAGVGKVGTTGQTATVLYDDLVDLVESVDENHLGMPDTQAGNPAFRPGFMVSQSARKMLRKLKDTAGRPIWTPGSTDANGNITPAQMLDYPVYVNNDMAAPAANAKSILFGNLASYLVRDAMELTLFRFYDSAYMKFGQVGFLAFARAGGNLLDSGAVKYYQQSAT
jgi:HK97 family phage major capsid protein